MKYFYVLLVLFSPIYTYCQDVGGVVVDSKSHPIQGATVTAKETGETAVTDKSGQFFLRGAGLGRILQVSYTGYKKTEVIADVKHPVRIVLEYAVSTLDEVQVVGYGTTTKRYSVGSVTTVKAEDIGKQPVTNPLAALQGRVPGLMVSSTSGLPGSTYKLQIRGQNTLASAPRGLGATLPLDNPLFIVDGVPFSAQNNNINQLRSLQSPGTGAAYNNPYGGFSPFNSINPADIESIEVLRDADATAIYGSRGGNGVILITTKKGRAERTDFQMDVSQGISMVGRTMRMMNTQEYLEMRREAIANGGLEPNLTQNSAGFAPDVLIFDQNKETDWKDFFLGGTAQNTLANTSVSGGTGSTQFRIGAGFNHNTYIYPGDFGEARANFMASADHTSVDRKLRLQFSANYSYYRNNSAGNANLLAAYTLEPNYPDLMDGYGNLVWTYGGLPLGRGGTGSNPLSYLENRYHIDNRNLTGSLVASYELTKDLRARTSLGYNTLYSEEYAGNPKAAQNPILNTQSSASFGNNNFSTWIIEPQIEYQKDVGDHYLGLLVGSTLQRDMNEQTMVTGTGYINDNLIGSISAASVKNATDAFSDYRYAAVFSRISYRFDNKYLVNVNARRDGSSRFGPGRRFGNFASLGVGWLFGQEPFFRKRLTFLSYGKLRGSYGTTGSDATSNYQYLSRWSTSLYSYSGTLGYIPQNLFNHSLGWATNKKFEAGLDLGFFNDRILLNTTYYNNRSGNQLITYALPRMTGFSNVVANWGAEVENMGIELMLQSTNVIRGASKWSSSFNLTIPRNRLVSFPGLETSSYSTIYAEGHSVNTLFGFRSAGVSEERGVFQFYDAEGNITSSPMLPSSGRLNDYQIIGSTDPSYYGGLLNTISHGNVQLDIFLEFRKQMGANYLRQVYSFLPGAQRNLPAIMLDRWRMEGDIAPHQRYSTQYAEAYDAASNLVLSDAVYTDASYIRFKTVSLSYIFPEALLKRLKLKNLLIFCNAQNLFTITSYLGNDPETQTIYGVPTPRTVVAGLNLTL